MSEPDIQAGHIARHAPLGASAQGREAAVVDVAQDLLLAYLSDVGILDAFAIKGGTALRKLYAGNEGRFSLDLDFAGAGLDFDQGQAVSSFIKAVERLELGPFRYGVSERRGRWSITFESPFVRKQSLATKLDFAPPTWLSPVEREWVPMKIHEQYGAPLPAIQTVRLEENIAEKIARLNRTTTARDMYDLAWLMRNPEIAHGLDRDLIRRLAVLKIWVDANGLRSTFAEWKPAHAGFAFLPEKWLRARSEGEFDLEDIGALAVPTPSVEELSETVAREYAFLADLTSEERVLAESGERDRSLALRCLMDLPDGRLRKIGIY